MKPGRKLFPAGQQFSERCDLHSETHVHDLDGIAFPGRVVNALTLFQKTQRLTRRIGQPLHVWVARLAQRPPRGQSLFDLNFTDHAARDSDNRIFGESLEREPGQVRRH